MTVDQLVPAAALQEDLAFLFDTLEAVHPNLYYRTPATAHRPQRRAVHKALTQPLTRRAFYQRVAPLVGQVADGHTLLHPPYADFAAWNDQERLLFPFDLTIHDTTATIAATFAADSDIPVGAEVVAINHMPMPDLLERLAQYSIGERRVRRLQVVQDAFRILFWALDNAETFIVDIKTSHGIHTQQVRGVSNSVIASQRPPVSPAETPAPYSFRRLPDTSIGLLEFRVADDLERFVPFVRDTFASLRQDNLQHLILDLRANQGGSSDLGNVLLTYLADRPVQEYATMDVKVSDEIKAYYARPDAPYRQAPHYEDIMQAPSGTVVSFAGQPLVPQPAAERFHGDLYVLIGPHTYSAAVMLAATIKDYQLGQLLGAETGGLATQYGDIYPFELPHTGLRAIVSHKRFLRPSGRDDGRGVVPDVDLGVTAMGTLAHSDLTLDSAVAKIRARRGG